MRLDLQTGKNMGLAIDYLVDAISEPAAPLRRVLILIDIDEHPMCTQADIVERLGIDKSAISRNVDWLVDYGLVVKFDNPAAGRGNQLQLIGNASQSIGYALSYFSGSHYYLKNFLHSLNNSFKIHKATLRDIKILFTVTTYGKMSRQDIRDHLYNGSLATYNRAIANLIEEGLIQE